MFFPSEPSANFLPSLSGKKEEKLTQRVNLPRINGYVNIFVVAINVTLC